MINITFRNISRLFFLFLKKTAHNYLKRDCFDKYYIPFVEVKDLNVLIYKKPIFDKLTKKAIGE